MGTKSVRDVMVGDPWTVDANLSIDQAARLMRSWDMSDVLVTDGGELRGVLTRQDITVLAIASGRHPSQVRAGDHAAPLEHWLAADDGCEHALDYMYLHDLRHLPVLDDRQLVGTVWVGDLAAATAARRDTLRLTG